MRQLALAGLIAVIAGQASALSCMPLIPSLRFNARQIRPAHIMSCMGRWISMRGFCPKGNGTNAVAEPAPIPAFFRGNGLSPTGFNLRFDQPVTLQSVCAGPWCGERQRIRLRLLLSGSLGTSCCWKSAPVVVSYFQSQAKPYLRRCCSASTGTVRQTNRSLVLAVWRTYAPRHPAALQHGVA